MAERIVAIFMFASDVKAARPRATSDVHSRREDDRRFGFSYA